MDELCDETCEFSMDLLRCEFALYTASCRASCREYYECILTLETCDDFDAWLEGHRSGGVWKNRNIHRTGASDPIPSDFSAIICEFVQFGGCPGRCKSVQALF